MTSNFVLQPISDADASRLRAHGGASYIANESPGFPCRQCLRDADVGEELILVSHDPFSTDSPYRSASPIFLHREPCTYEAAGGIPIQLARRQLSVRAFDAEELMVDARVIDGAELGETIEGFLAADATAKVHIHNAWRGCWAATALGA